VAKIDVAMGGRAAEEIVFGKDKVKTFREEIFQGFVGRIVLGPLQCRPIIDFREIGIRTSRAVLARRRATNLT
jgi:hypothetical protein